MDDLTWLGIADAGRLFRRRELSPVEYTRHLLQRIDRLDKQCHAFLLLTPEDALAQAAIAGKDIRRGVDLGPMHGIPFAAKDIIDVAGLPTTCHSRIRRNHSARQDADVIAHLRSAGAVLLGKTALHEFGVGGPTEELPWPAARNPWHLDMHPGGSSSGSGTAVAAGFAPAAIGTDTGGSVRNPATSCGIVGMKPTYGLVSCNGVFPLAPSLDHVGPMTRNVEDNAILLAAMTGQPGYDATLRNGISGLRIGVIEHFYIEDATAHPEQVAALNAALGVLRDLGAIVTPLRVANLMEWRECGRIVQQFEQYEIHRRWLDARPDDYCALSLAKLRPGKDITQEQYEVASLARRRLTEDLGRALRGLDAVVTLSGLDLPCRLDRPDLIARTYMNNARMPFSLSGFPALAVPTGFSGDGLPLGMQLVGKRHDEELLYRIAWAYCDATDWLSRHPGLH